MKTAFADGPRVEERPDQPVTDAAGAHSPWRSGARLTEPTSSGQLRVALKEAVHLFARDPCEANAARVEVAIAALRRRDARAG